MSAKLRTLPTKLKPTNRVLIRIAGTDYFVDVGNVIDCDPIRKVDRAEHFTAQVGDDGQGYARGDGNLPKTITDGYKVTLDEVTNANLALINLTQPAEDANQAAAPTQAVAIASITKGRSYRLGFYGLSAHALLFDGVSATENVDFFLDYNSGLLTIPTTSGLDDGIAVSGTVAVPEARFKRATNTTKTYCTGEVVIELWDQFSETIPRQVISIGDAALYVTKYGKMEHGKYMDFELEIYALTKPVVDERQD